MSVSIETKGLAERARKLSSQKSLLDWIGAVGSEDIGVDIGTSNVVVYVKHKGIVFPEAAVIARNEITGEYFSYGTKAEEMEGKTPKEIQIVRPIKRGAINDYNAAAYLLNSIVTQSYLRGMFFHPRLMMCVSKGVNSVERRALLEAAVAMGARKTVLIDQPLAAAMGLGLAKEGRVGSLVVDLGGGSTKVSVLSSNGIVVSHFGTESGLEMDQAVMAVVREKYHVRIGRKEAENLKIALGAAWDLDQAPRVAETYGLSVVSGCPMKIAVTGEDVAYALNPILYKIFKNIQDVLQRTPPALLASIREQGILLIGGVSQLKGMDELITRITSITARVAERPSYVNAIGAGMSLQYINDFRDSLQDLH